LTRLFLVQISAFIKKSVAKQLDEMAEDMGKR
jgi:hypothetical protein